MQLIVSKRGYRWLLPLVALALAITGLLVVADRSSAGIMDQPFVTAIDKDADPPNLFSDVECDPAQFEVDADIQVGTVPSGTTGVPLEGTDTGLGERDDCPEDDWSTQNGAATFLGEDAVFKLGNLSDNVFACGFNGNAANCVNPPDAVGPAETGTDCTTGVGVDNDTDTVADDGCPNHPDVPVARNTSAYPASAIAGDDIATSSETDCTTHTNGDKTDDAVYSITGANNQPKDEIENIYATIKAGTPATALVGFERLTTTGDTHLNVAFKQGGSILDNLTNPCPSGNGEMICAGWMQHDLIANVNYPGGTAQPSAAIFLVGSIVADALCPAGLGGAVLCQALPPSPAPLESGVGDYCVGSGPGEVGEDCTDTTDSAADDDDGNGNGTTGAELADPDDPECIQVLSLSNCNVELQNKQLRCSENFSNVGPSEDDPFNPCVGGTGVCGTAAACLNAVNDDDDNGNSSLAAPPDTVNDGCGPASDIHSSFWPAHIDGATQDNSGGSCAGGRESATLSPPTTGARCNPEDERPLRSFIEVRITSGLVNPCFQTLQVQSRASGESVTSADSDIGEAGFPGCKIRIEKKDQAGNLIQDATQFKLEPNPYACLDANGSGDDDVSPIFVTDGDTTETFDDPADNNIPDQFDGGDGVIELLGVCPGNYLVTETVAPPGYGLNPAQTPIEGKSENDPSNTCPGADPQCGTDAACNGAGDEDDDDNDTTQDDCPEIGTQCQNNANDDSNDDTVVNDGCGTDFCSVNGSTVSTCTAVIFDPLGTLEWEKRDESQAGHPLQGGATFLIDPNPWWCHSDSLNGTPTPDPARKTDGTDLPNLPPLDNEALSVLDNAAGIDADADNGQFKINNVCSDTTYTIKETAAPAGFEKDDDIDRPCTVSDTDLNCVVGTALTTPPSTDDDSPADESDFHNRKGSLLFLKARKDKNSSSGQSAFPGATFRITAASTDPTGGSSTCGAGTIADPTVNNCIQVTDDTDGTVGPGLDKDPGPGSICLDNILLNTSLTITEFATNDPDYVKDSTARTATVTTSSQCASRVGFPAAVGPAEVDQCGGGAGAGNGINEDGDSAADDGCPTSGVAADGAPEFDQCTGAGVGVGLGDDDDGDAIRDDGCSPTAGAPDTLTPAGPFVNTPLSEIQVQCRSLGNLPGDDGDPTRCQIVCTNASPEIADSAGSSGANNASPGDNNGEDGSPDNNVTPEFDDTDEIFTDLAPDTYTCTIVIDP